MIYSTEK